jgi:hypothetical protein
MRRRGDEENPFNMPDDVYLDMIDYYERLKKRNAVNYKDLVTYVLDTRQGKEWFEKKYAGGNEFNLRQDLEEYFNVLEGEPMVEGMPSDPVAEAWRNRRSSRALRPRAVELIHDIERADEEMLGRKFVEVLEWSGLKEKIENTAWEAAMEIVHTGPHVDKFAKIVMDEGFADNESDAIDIVIYLAEWWVPMVSGILRGAISDVGSPQR